MPESNNKSQPSKKLSLLVVGVVLLFLIAGLMLLMNNHTSTQATNALSAKLRFHGEYCMEGGQWQPIVEGEHISATKGDVRLRGNFYVYTPDGEYVGKLEDEAVIALYSDHVNVTIDDGIYEPFVMDTENPVFGKSACGVYWTGYIHSADVSEEIEILIHNPHRFGNETAVDQFLNNVAFWNNIDFERSVLASGEFQRNIGIMFLIISIFILGTALFSSLVHIKNSRIIWVLGLAILFQGVYLSYHAEGVSFWSDSIANNTSILGFSMMFYMLFISGIITEVSNKTKKAAIYTTVAVGVMDALCLIVSIVSKIYFYDTWWIWVIGQTAANVVLLCCLIVESLVEKSKKRWAYIAFSPLLIAFEVDALATYLGWWEGGLVSKYIFVVLFIVALIIVLIIIPSGINAAAKAKELEIQNSRLEAELKDSRISIMLSQIQPHFIYNTLGTIERMCLKDPKKAFELVRNFSLYLRGNFSELDSVVPIRFSEELKHVEYYANIEKVRFPDMNIIYDIESKDFVLPALSVQPLVENSIKHGLMRLETGGTVNIRSYENDTNFIIEVKDDGVGFDTALPVDEKKHVGLRNIRGRLKAMVNGELIIESKIGEGTKATIKIPKEVIK